MGAATLYGVGMVVGWRERGGGPSVCSGEKLMENHGSESKAKLHFEK